MLENTETLNAARRESIGWRSVVSLLWLITLLGGCAAIFFLYLTLSDSNGAPQQAAGAAIAIAFVAIPYIIARAVEGIRDTMI